MKPYLLLRLSVFCVGLLLSACQKEDVAPEPLFYYGFNQKIPLTVVENKVIIRYAPPVDSAQTVAVLRAVAPDAVLEWQDKRTVVIRTDMEEARQQLLRSASTEARVVASNPVYATEGGAEVGITDEILVKFRPETSQSQQEAIFKQYGLTVVRSTELFLVLRAPKGTDALRIANRMQESRLTEYSYPNFFAKIELHGPTLGR